MSNELTVHIVDDDSAVRDAVGLLLSIHGYRVALFASAEQFLQSWQPGWQGCLLLDIRMPGMDGLTLQQRLQDLGCTLPVIVVSGHADVAMARQAFKANASDFLEKPFDEAKLLAAIDEALQTARAALGSDQARSGAVRLLATLTAREREIMELVVAGKHNREIAPLLGISVRTVEAHKANLMSKLSVTSLAELVRLALH